ncbi:hypothetical protein DPMN_102372, partial [Dreissena polymorpha]
TGEACSHVAALLFKVEAAVKLDLTNPSKARAACVWNRCYREKYAQRTGETVSGMKTRAGDSETGHKGRAACLHSFGGAAYRQEFVLNCQLPVHIKVAAELLSAMNFSQPKHGKVPKRKPRPAPDTDQRYR